ncbi:MAG: CocE/NonD family hydrolase [Planctomycetes bacterium]|nr:CocE/NonD family hydrolase [Planctomycetota bacterium]
MYVEKKNTPKQILAKLGCLIKPPNVQVKEISPSVKILRDAHIPTRDGNYLSANIYMPSYEGTFPVIISLHPGRKDVVCKDGYMHIQFKFARQPGQITFSNETSFEAPDPDFWATNGYVVINIDKRGFGISPKAKEPQVYFGQEEIKDIYDSIEWAGVQPWSNGNVGLLGVSYLAINQYKVATMNPPHLKAIIPWEGVSDLYKDWFYPGGVMEVGFTPFLFSRLQNFGDGFDMGKQQLERPTRDEWWQSFVADFEKIKVPMLNCISFASQMLHTRGSQRVYHWAGSEHKWLYTHRGGEWTAYYSTEVNALMLKFFDYFLKGISNGMLEHPKVRLEIREFGDAVKQVRFENQFPPENVVWTSFYLDGQNGSLSVVPTVPDSKASFDLAKDNLQYSYIFERDTEIVGPMKLTLYVELEGCDDANLFAGVQKFHNGKEVNFDGTYGFPNDIVTKTAQRVALRTVNEELSTPYSPEHDFDTLKPLQKGEVAKMELQLEPSATFFRKGDELCLVVQGRYFIGVWTTATERTEVGSLKSSKSE